MHAFLSLPSLRRVVLIAVAVGATCLFGMTAHAQTVVGPGQTLNLANSSYTGVSLLLEGGTVSGSGNYNAYGASVITGVTVSGTVASTINGSSWFNISNPTTFTVADVTGNASTDLNVNISLRPLPGSPDTNYSSSSIIKEGAGTMEMTVHSYIWGPMTLNGGTLKVSGGNSGYGYFSGVVDVNAATTLTIDSDGTGFGYQNGWKPTSVNINGGTVNGGGNHVWGISGGVNMTGGTLQVDTGSFQWNYTDLNTSASADTATIAGPLTLRADGGYSGLSVNVADGAAATDLLISGNITEQFGSMSISKSGSGTLRLSGTSSYSGNTTVSQGVLAVSTSGKLYGAFSNTSVVTVASGVTLQLNGWSWDAAGSLGQLTYDAGRLVINGGTLEYAGNSNFNAGDPGSSSRTFTIGTGGATLKASSPAGQAWTLTAGNGNLSNGNGLTLAGAGAGVISNVIEGAGSLTKSDSGTWTLSAANTYSGTTAVSGGTLVAGNAAAFGSGGVSLGSGATLDLGGYALGNAMTNSGGSLLNAASYTGSQSVVGTTSLTGTIGGGLTVDAGGTLKGTGTTFTGPVTIAAGGVHSPGGSPGSQTFSGGFAYAASSTLTWELIANTTGNPGTDYDFLTVTSGNLAIDSSSLLSLEFLNTGSTASSVNWNDSFWGTSQTWTIIDFTSGGTSTGVFTLAGGPSTWLDSTSASLSAARPGASFSVANQGGDVVLSYAAVPEPSTIALAGLAGLAAAIAARRR